MGKTCYFIGHHNAPAEILPLLETSVEHHIAQYGVMDFVVGKYGSFDCLAARAVRKAKQRHPEIRLTLLLAYYNPTQSTGSLSGFDDTLYPDGLELVPKRAAIVRANQHMIQHSDYLIAYDKGYAGNTRKLVKYARAREERGLICIENLAEIL